MSDERCELCRFWISNTFNDTGLCRRYPPKVYGDVDGNIRDGDGQVWTSSEVAYPFTAKGEWCGEFKAKEESDGE